MPYESSNHFTYFEMNVMRFFSPAISGMGAVCFLAAHNLHVYEAWNTILMLITMNVFTTWNDVAVNALAVRVLDTNQLRGAGATVQLIGWSNQNPTIFRHGFIKENKI